MNGNSVQLSNSELETGFQLGEWFVEPLAGCFVKENHRVHVEPKVMDVLICLARAQGEVVSRDHILDEAWPDVVVSEEVLTRAISELRTLLGDTQRQRQYIRTIPKRGYQLIAKTSAKTGPAALGASSAPASVEAPLDIKPLQTTSLPDSPEAPGSATAPQGNSKPTQLPPTSAPKSSATTVKWLSLAAAIVISVLIGAPFFYKSLYEENSELRFEAANISQDALPPAPPLPPTSAGDTHTITAANTNTNANNDIPTLAVMPFMTLSSDIDPTFFSEGLSEDIRSALIDSPGIRVLARTSSESFRNKALDVREIGRQLGVHSLLEGTVRISDNNARITMQLTDTESGYPFWSATYDRELVKVFDVQREIAEDVVKQLAPQLRLDLVEDTEHAPQARYHYLLGRHFWHQRSPESLKLAFDSFSNGLEVDDSYAPLYSGLSDTHIFSHIYGGAPLDEAMAAARESANRAITLAPNLAEAHASLGLIYEVDQDEDAAMQSYERAVTLNPSNTMARMWYGNTLSAKQRVRDAFEQYQKALEIDPLHPVVMQNYLSAMVSMGRSNEAIEIAENMLNVFNVSGNDNIVKPYLHAINSAGRLDDLLSFLVRYSFPEEKQELVVELLASTLIKLQRYNEAAQLLGAKQEKTYLEGAFYQQALLALYLRDSGTLRELSEKITPSPADTSHSMAQKVDTECYAMRRRYWHGLANYIDNNYAAAAQTLKSVMDSGFLDCSVKEHIKVSLLIYLADATKQIAAGSHLPYLEIAQQRVDRSLSLGWRNTEILVAKLAVSTIAENNQELDTTIQTIKTLDGQPWSEILLHPLFDRYRQQPIFMNRFSDFQQSYNKVKDNAENVPLGRFGVN